MPEPTPINDSREHEAARAAAMPVSRRVEIDKKTGWLDVYEREHGEGDWMLIGSHSPVGWLAERDTRIAELEDQLELAWGLIANAWDGSWDKATDEWRAAAERWRDRYHA